MNEEENKPSATQEDDFAIDENKGNSLKLKQENEFFNEESYVVYPLVNVSYVEYTDGSEDWEILSDKKIALTLNGYRFTNKEKKFLKTHQGMTFVISGYKSGWKTVAEFKRQIKKAIPKKQK